MISGTMDCDSVIDRRLYADEDHFGRDNKDENIQRLENQAAFFVPRQAEGSRIFFTCILPSDGSGFYKSFARITSQEQNDAEDWLIMRDHYEEQLRKLNEYVAEMGELIEKAISDAMDALMHKDVEEAQNTINYDNRIDHMEREIEGLCLNLLLSQQPVATDLRMVSAALKMITDMERIGDHAADISEITLALAKTGYPSDLSQIQKMADETMRMVKNSMEAYLEKDMQKASAVIRQDDIVDDCFVRIKRDVIRQINENIRNGEQAADVLMIVKYLERIGDHATNIAEWVLFYITGGHSGNAVAKHPEESSKGRFPSV